MAFKFDPIVDEKVDRLLGHLRKSFEGVLTADSLGPMYGGYGTFLPTYVRQPSALFLPPPSAHVITKKDQISGGNGDKKSHNCSSSANNQPSAPGTTKNDQISSGKGDKKSLSCSSSTNDQPFAHATTKNDQLSRGDGDKIHKKSLSYSRQKSSSSANDHKGPAVREKNGSTSNDHKQHPVSGEGDKTSLIPTDKRKKTPIKAGFNNDKRPVVKDQCVFHGVQSGTTEKKATGLHRVRSGGVYVHRRHRLISFGAPARYAILSL